MGVGGNASPRSFTLAVIGLLCCVGYRAFVSFVSASVTFQSPLVTENRS